MTRKGWRFQAAGDKDKSEKIAQIEAACKRFAVEEVLREAAMQDGLFGRGHIYIDLGTTDDPDELKTPIGNGRDKVSTAKVAKGSLRGFKTVEAVWCYPTNYNAHDPLSDDWYNPSSWYVMGKEIHASRLLTFIGREVPDLLKPAYSFGGLSLSQMLRRYIKNWYRTQESVSDLIHSFSVSGILTDMVGAVELGPDKLERRARLFNNLRDNKGLMLLNKETEEFFNVSTPLGTLDHLQAQAQEHIASIAGIPLVKLLGVTPSGLNASSDGEIRCFYDWILAYQELLFTSKLHTILGFIQLNEFGSVDPDITFEYEPLWSLDEKSLAEKHPPGVAPPVTMAMDDSLASPLAWAGGFTTSMYLGAEHFIGYPELAILAQIPEYRKISETIATEMTRKGWRFQAAGDKDKSAKIAQIEAACKRFAVEDVLREAALHDGLYGRGHVYIDLGTTADPDELKTPIGNGRDKVSTAKVAKGSLRGLKTIEAVWCYPLNYNAHDPLSDDWYNPSSWYVNRKEVHASRLLTFIGREVPDLLKPAYSFGGLSLSQMLRRYIRNWHRTQESISDLIHSFSVSGILTDLVGALQTGSDGLVKLDEFFCLSSSISLSRNLTAYGQDNESVPQALLLVATSTGCRPC